MTETIVPNVHKAILRLLLDWVSLCPNDFQQNPSRRELVDFLNRVSLLGENYRWLVDEIRLQAHINVCILGENRISMNCNLCFLLYQTIY